MGAIDESDCAQLLQHTFRQMREIGLADLADQLIATMPLDPGRPSRQLLHFLDGFAAEMRLQDGATARTILDRLEHVAHTEDGKRIEGLWLDMAPAHRELYGVDGVDLAAERDMRPLIQELEELGAEVRESLRRSD